MAARETQTKNTKVVHCTRGTHDVYIGRPSQWGNPFVIGKDGTREQVIEQYRNWLMTQPSLLAALPELKGRTLGCWCAPAAATAPALTSHYGRQPDFPFASVRGEGAPKNHSYA